jgi:hypothetical protein
MVRAIRGEADHQEGIVIFENGIRAPLKDEILHNAHEGTIVWTAKEPDCIETVSEVYQGMAQLRNLKNSDPNRGLYGSILMIEDIGTGQFAGLALKHTMALCRTRCHATQIKGLVACLLRDNDTPIPKAEFRASMDQRDIGIQTQLSHLHINTNLRMHGRFEAVQSDLCEIDRKLIQARLQTIAGSDNTYGFSDILGLGYQVTSDGAAAYVTKCVPVEVTRVAYPNCTTNIPVLYNGTIVFADPITWTLQEFPNVVTCDDLYPTMWKVGPEWYCATPEVRICRAPEQMEVSTRSYTPLGDFTRGLGLDAFTEEQRRAHRTHIINAMSRISFLSEAASDAIENSPGQGKFGIPVDDYDYNALIDSIGSRIFPFFHTFGRAWTVIIGVLLIISMCKLLGGSIIRMCVITQERGCGWWVILSAWATLFGILRMPSEILRAAVNSAKAPLEARDTIGPSPQMLYSEIQAKERQLERTQKDLEAARSTRNDTISFSLGTKDTKQEESQALVESERK